MFLLETEACFPLQLIVQLLEQFLSLLVLIGCLRDYGKVKVMQQMHDEHRSQESPSIFIGEV